jgi:hypothetical protein
MNRYQFRVPRVAFAVAALALTAVTIGLAVVLPAQIAFVSAQLVAAETFDVVVAAARDSLVFRTR